MKAPCKDCPNRHPNCHSQCEKYKEFRNYCDEVLEKKHKEKEDRYFAVKRIAEFRKQAKRGK